LMNYLFSESYVHKEDLEHFAAHDKIELEEENKEREYQGLPPFKNIEEAEAAREKEIAEAQARWGRFARQPPPEKQDPKLKFKDASAEAQAKPEWGEGDDAYLRPKSAADKLRKNLPYKVLNLLIALIESNISRSISSGETGETFRVAQEVSVPSPGFYTVYSMPILQGEDRTRYI